jgi:hypothetical protein
MSVQLKRRQFITLLGSAAVWPLAASAQQPGRVVRIGFVGPAIDRPSLMFVPNYQAFLAQLHVLGFVEGQNLIVTYGAVDDPRGLAVVAAEAEPNLCCNQSGLPAKRFQSC